MDTALQPDSTLENVKVIHHIYHVTLYDYGYEKSGSVKGDPEVYVSFLNRILNGDLVEEPNTQHISNRKAECFTNIAVLEKKRDETELENSKIEAELKEKEKDIDAYRKQLLHTSEILSRDHEKVKTESFSKLKFILNLFILIMLSVYLFFFYISATYKALYVDFEATAERIARGEGTGSIMPGPYELADALQYNYLLLVVPFVFYAFGWAFHILLELKSNAKYVFLPMLVLVTFIVDFLLAMIISNNIESAKSLMGIPTIFWYESPSFYIILFLGFLVYIIWSILLDSLLREWAKKEIVTNLKTIINHLQNDCKILQKRKKDTSLIHNKISEYQEDMNVVMHGNLKRYIDQFSSGWIAYLAPSNLKSAKERCLQLKKEFENKHNIRHGTVKVIRKGNALTNLISR
ncbi:MAG: hypothetical protein ABI663_21305 [Chryseolinea sp.]